MNTNTEDFQKMKEEVARIGDDELVILERIAFEELIKREAKKMLLRLVDQQK